MEKQECEKLGGVWEDSRCFLPDERMPDPILDRVWGVFNERCGSKPSISFRRQHATAVAWRKERKITMREDSWKKMHPAERRLTVIHESLHMCGIPHREGFRTSQDYASPIVYGKVYGDDIIICDFKDRIGSALKKYVRDPKLIVYHATIVKNLAGIKKEGLKTPEGVMPSKWFMVTDSLEGAKEYATGDEPIIIHYEIPTSEVDKYLWPGGDPSEIFGTQFGLRQPLPSKYISKITKINDNVKVYGGLNEQ